jgi:hypothetical protein
LKNIRPSKFCSENVIMSLKKVWFQLLFLPWATFFGKWGQVVTEVIYFPGWFLEMNSGGAIHGNKIIVGKEESNGKGI